MTYIYITNVFNVVVSSILIEQYLHIFQLKDYKTQRYFHFFIKKSYYLLIFITFLLIFLINHIFFHNIILITSINLLTIFTSTILSITIIKSDKTPIRYTARLKRLYSISILLIFLINLSNYGTLISLIFLPLTPAVANMLNFYDKIRNKKFIHQAVKKLKLQNIKIIAITGSNGKTSVKNILTQYLSIKYKVQSTPKSYNTELGIAMFINNNLKPDTEYLILEYGARHKYDVKRLCELFGADIGVITCVHPQHIETFKTIDTVAEAKSKLSQYLKSKPCIYNLDNIYTSNMYNNKEGVKIGVSLQNPSDIYANNIEIIDNKTHFELHINKSVYHISTLLLGRHNVTNILLSMATAIHLHIDISQLIDATIKLQYTPHRLELIQTHINILDDSYNCSIASAEEALWVLSRMPGRHITATPGIIEGGKFQYTINRTLGQKLNVCDTVIIIGRTNSQALLDGLNQSNYSGEIIQVDTLEQAKKRFLELKKGDTLLLLNDLPDDYR